MKFLISLLLPLGVWALTLAGVAEVDITPSIGTPSAGFAVRERPMEGVRDPLYASALYLKTDEEEIAWCAVDHLGMTYDMCSEVTQRVHQSLKNCQVFVSSSHTHSGSGGFLPFGEWSEQLAGKFDPTLRENVIAGCVTAICKAATKTEKARVGIDIAPMTLNRYRGLAPKDASPRKTLTLIKVETENGKPIAALFVWPCHPTSLSADNLLFSADFIAESRSTIRETLHVVPIYINGAQGDVLPAASCEEVGLTLGETIVQLWPKVITSEELDLQVIRKPYRFKVKPTVQGLKLPVDEWPSELNLISMNDHLFLTVGGEMSCVYDHELTTHVLEHTGKNLTICGLTNDAHGYIITPAAWQAGGVEARTSFGGKNYGPDLLEQAKFVIK